VDERETEGVRAELPTVRWSGQRAATRCGAALVTRLGQMVEGSEEEEQRASGDRISCRIANVARGSTRR
jgi:hypothetical protein